MASNLSNGDGTVTVYAKVTNTALSKEIIAKIKYNIDTSNENNTYEADSLIKAIENYDYGSGIATVKVNNETYNLRVYEFAESTDIDITTPFGLASDVATASTYAKNTVVIKVNGDLTIKEGVTLTSYNTAYGGTKGMMVYCTGTLTNNGNISMTARGAKAVGENVYLWKNKDGSYEYVPATGGAGGAGFSVSRTVYVASIAGRTGIAGSGRQTRWWWNTDHQYKIIVYIMEPLVLAELEHHIQEVQHQLLLSQDILMRLVEVQQMEEQMEELVLLLQGVIENLIIIVEEEQEIQEETEYVD